MRLELTPTPQRRPADLVLWGGIRRSLAIPANRSGLRFAATIVAVDLLVLAILGESTGALLAALAVCIHLYFLDFEGDLGERFVGHGVATLVGAFAVVLAVVCASPLWLAVIVTIVVSSTFAYLRVLRGYVSRSAVGLQGAFFLPVMVTAHRSDLPSLLVGWSLGSAVSILAALVVLPHRRSGLVRRLLAQWLRAAADLCAAIASGGDQGPTLAALQASRDELLAQVTSSFTQPGAVGHRQRAIAGMVSGARWSMPIAERLTAMRPTDPSTLAMMSADAFQAAADLVEGGTLPTDLPDLPNARTRDLEQLAAQSPEVLASHYPVRLLSIGAMNQLFQAALSRGRKVPSPDVGRFDSARPSTVLLQNLRGRSLWLQNALRTGLGAATCVVIVRTVGVDHGLWVVLAALTVTQVSLSGASGAKAMVRIVLGATGGVLIAGLLAMLHLPYPVYVCALPIAAFAAKRVAGLRMDLAQFFYTQFALINFAVLTWPPRKGLEGARFQDILLGAAVAAGFSLLVFPNGVSQLLERLRSKALGSARNYLASSIAGLSGTAVEVDLERGVLLRDLGSYENALDAAFMHQRKRTPVLMAHEKASSTARDLLIGGDACAELAELVRHNPKFAPVAVELAQWWGRFSSDPEAP